MTEQQTPAAAPAPQAPEVSAPPKPQKRKRKKKYFKRILSLALVLAILAGGGYALWYFVLKPEPVEQGEIYSMPATIGRALWRAAEMPGPRSLRPLP